MKQINPHWAKSNPGALHFILQIGRLTQDKSDLIVLTIESLPELRGTNLWVMYSDLCNQDLEKVYELCKKVPLGVINEACSFQDYSGKELIKPYLEA